MLIQNTTEDYICFFDDDIIVPKDYFEAAVNIITKNQCDVLGGPDQSITSEGLGQRVIGEILSESLVMGPTKVRHSKEEAELKKVDETALTLCNLWFKKSLFNKNQIFFNESLRRCEENDLLIRLRAVGCDFYYSSKIFVYHKRRLHGLGLIKIQYFSGFYRGIVTIRNFKNSPSFFVIPFLTGAFLIYSLVYPSKLFFILVLLHSLLNCWISFKLWSKLRGASFFMGLKYILIIHLSFSVGIFMGTLFSVGKRYAKD